MPEAVSEITAGISRRRKEGGMDGEEARWAGLGPEDVEDDPIAKERAAELVRNLDGWMKHARSVGALHVSIPLQTAESIYAILLALGLAAKKEPLLSKATEVRDSQYAEVEVPTSAMVLKPAIEQFVGVCDRFVSILERVEKIIVKKLEEEEKRHETTRKGR